MSKQLISVLMIELIILLPLAVVAQDANVTTTAAEDKTPPFINATIPYFVTTNRLDITGTTEPMSTVYLYVNGVKQRKSTPNMQGTFNFPSVDLSSLVPANTIKLESVDPADNINFKEFTVVVDLTKPELNILTKFPDLTNISTWLVRGTVSEAVKLDIILDQNNTVYSAENVTSINQTIALAEGINLIEIIAKDKANNTDKFKTKTYLDTEPPTIENLTPSSGSFFYETDTQTDIEGATEPFAKIELYLETREVDPITGNVTTKREKLASTNADENGNFKLDDVDLVGTTIIPGFLTVGGTGTQPTQVPPGLEEALPQPQRPQEEISLNLVLVAIDRMGLSTELSLNYRIGTCYSGEASWNVINMIEYQSPTSMSPERLEEGTEIMSFILNISYQGLGKEPIIRDVRFERACEAESMQDDNLYKYSCKILPHSPTIKKPNDAKTLWYIRYNLKKLEGLNDFSDDLWEDLTKQFKFPLKVKVEYTHKILNPNTGKYEEIRDFQTKCMDIAMHVDTSRIDPRDVLPDWLLDDGAEFLNETITNLDKAIEALDEVMKYIGGACAIMFGVRLITTIHRRWVANFEHIEDQIISKTPGATMTKPAPCPKVGTSDFKKLFEEEIKKITQEKAEDIAKEGFEKVAEKEMPTGILSLLQQQNTDALKKKYEKQLKELKQNDLPTNFTKENTLSEIYNLFTLCPKTYAAWKKEASVYNSYRWICDRFLCRSSPAEWTGNATFETIRLKIQKAAGCSEITSTQGIILRSFPAENCKFKGGPYPECWVYKGAVYAHDTGAGDDATLKRVGGVSSSIPPGDTPETLKVTTSGKNVFLKKEKTKKCKDLCVKKKYQDGKCLTSFELKQELQKKGTTDRVFSALQQDADCPKEGPICYCLDRQGTIKEPPTDEKGWSYRYQRLGYYYDPYKYYEGRDKPACFGQDSWLNKDEPYLNTGDAWPAFQCVCVPQIRNRLVAAKNFISGLVNCLQQIKTTGMADTGFCKEVFTQYICKWIYRGITRLTNGCTPWSGAGKSPELGNKLRGGADAIFGGVQEATDALLDDYNNAALRNYIGVGEGAIAEKVCLGALTGDWGFNLEGFIDAAYSQPMHSSVNAWPADREYLTWDPDTEEATYEYRVAWMITPGCDIDRYTVSLSCVSDYELYNYDGVACERAKSQNADENDNSPSGCDCTSDAYVGISRVNQEAPGPSRVIYTGRGLKQSSYESRSVHTVQTGLQRYDNVKITLYINNPTVASQCIPPGHLVGKRMGVFYAPISDATTYDIVACRFDQTQGYFRCDQGRLLWNLRGRAYFGNVKCNNVHCDEQVYYVEDTIKLNPFEVFVQGQKQCLFMQLYNKKGEKLLEREGRFIDLKPAEDDPTRTILVQGLNELDVLGGGRTITKSDFAKTPATWTVDPTSGSYAKLIQEGTVTNRETVSIYVQDTSEKPDQKGDKYLHEGTTEWQTWGKNAPVPIGNQGMIFEFTQQPMVPEKSTCTINDEKITPCREYKFTITEPRIISTDKPEDWRLQLELRHAPGNRSQGSCSESRSQDIITYQNNPQRKSITLKVKPWTKAEDIACRQGGLYKNLEAPCDCDGDGDIDEEDCDATTKFYCDEDECFTYPRCFAPNKLNLKDCDCDWDGKLDDNCTKKYCKEDKKCYPPPEKEKGKIIVTKENLPDEAKLNNYDIGTVIISAGVDYTKIEESAWQYYVSPEGGMANARAISSADLADRLSTDVI
ncbi:hypothetical protein KY331_05115 [Candidatus Woesearchaeota archaeon]|nr:hypothetical protein [Candidatus Woesearchaeota archaeon]